MSDIVPNVLAFADTVIAVMGLRVKKSTSTKELEQVKAGKIGHILCKRVSRFSRNVAERKKYADMLRIRDVTVEFEKERLRTDDLTGSFVFPSCPRLRRT